MGKLGIIGGTSLFETSMFSFLEPKTVSTPHGDAIIYVDPTNTSPIVFLQRHHADGSAGASVYCPPHCINHKANIAALQAEGVDRVVAVCCVGSLSPDIPIGSIVVPDDYFYLFGPSISFFDDARGHIVPGIDDALRGDILDAVRGTDIQTLRKGPATYVQTTGPRFETKAEVRFLEKLGDIIGMTAASEATLTKENEIPYAILAMVDNMANGLAGSELTQEQFHKNVANNRATVEKAVKAVLAHLGNKS